MRTRQGRVLLSIVIVIFMNAIQDFWTDSALELPFHIWFAFQTVAFHAEVSFVFCLGFTTGSFDNWFCFFFDCTSYYIAW